MIFSWRDGVFKLDKKICFWRFLKRYFFEKKERSYFFIFIILAFFAAFRWLGRCEFLGMP
ncbi:hypothetical protein B0E42_19110 [Pseudomonas sp. A25(2017)]|nr:hypothetical protein B0E42_19110 [Pseudomonas sp. A25(2017)]